jgi:hypothetical protein
MRSSLLLAALVVVLGACARTTMKGSVADRHGAAGETAELDFWDELSRQRAVTNHDALHALLLMAGKPGQRGFSEKLRLAEERGWLPSGSGLQPNETAEAGWIARAVCLELGIDGGLSMRVTRSHPRYALRELIDRGMLPELSTRQSVTGLQLIALVSEAEDVRVGSGEDPRKGFGK